MKSLEQALRGEVRGEIHFEEISRRVYSVDASIYEIEPIGIVLPQDKADLVAAVRIAYAHNIPVIARGAATGIAGGCIGRALILDLSKHLTDICEVNYAKEYVLCQPGVVQDTLNKVLEEKNYRLGPDTSTGNRATLGGMLANNAAGSRSLRYGKMVDHVEAVELLLANGELLQLENLTLEAAKSKSLQNDSEGRIYKALLRLREVYRDEIQKRFPKIPRRVSGYNLDELIKETELGSPLNLSKLIAGSEGTLGIVTEMKLKIVKRPDWTGLCIIHVQNMQEGLQAIPFVLSFSPLAVEMIDRHILQAGRSSPTLKNKLEWLKGDPAAVFAIEFDAPTQEEVLAKLQAFELAMRQRNIGYSHVILTEKTAMEHVWEVRKAGLGLLLSKRTYSRAIAFIEDISVAPEKLPAFMEKFQLCLRKYQKEAGIYGHAGSGCLHIRPYIDLRQPQELVSMRQLMEDVADLLLEAGGALSGEHGDGLVRSWLNKKMFGETLYAAFVEIKAAFDPKNRMNPGKIVHAPDLLQDLRMNPQIVPPQMETFLDFKAEGGFHLAVDMCNGNGLCRKKEGTMCPSFQASGDEYHTTRARAQALRAIVNGRLPLKDFTSTGLYDVLDLCLECKGCKTECPSSVDMAKMKAEFLYQYGKKHGYPLRSRLFAGIGNLGKMSTAYPPLAHLVNYLLDSRLAKKVLEHIGIAKERALPQFAAQRFSQWFAAHQQKRHLQTQNLGKGAKQVVLFNDTYTEFQVPHIGKAAVKVLHALGFEVILPKWSCCGRPQISKGFLQEARHSANQLVETLHPFAQQGIPIIGLEPSCLFTIRDDFHGLLGSHDTRVGTLVAACQTLDQFLEQRLVHMGDKLPIKLSLGAQSLASQPPRQVKVHTHCYQKALAPFPSTKRVLQSIPAFEVSEVESGCCGMAGSFGYEKEHYAFSMKIGQLKLFPSIMNLRQDGLVVANGFSCRSQILHGTQRSAQHIAEILADSMGDDYNEFIGNLSQRNT